ncbi:hypothetical protein [Halomonas sp. E19]|uniref:hypothetical protein n=1 Tax=Halomonas sp. E19 TaxID=3397247 RepID=UPI004033759F
MIQDELLRICADTRQTVFMITHDVDEAILLADKILLMSNGPRAHIAEIVINTLPRSGSARQYTTTPSSTGCATTWWTFWCTARRSFRRRGTSSPPTASPKWCGRGSTP